MDRQAICRHIDGRVKKGLLPGAVCGVFIRGEPMFEYISGYSDAEKKTPLKRDAVFRLASMTKPITAAAVLICEDKGLLKLEDPVSRYIPEFRRMRVGCMKDGAPVYASDAKREITLFDVLTHSSGLGSGDVGTYQYERRSLPDSLEEAAADYGHWLLDFSPGESQCYSAGVAFDLPARIVETVSGQAYPCFLKENIFDPLGMRDTGYTLSEEAFSRVVRMYRQRPDKSMEPRDFGRYGFPEFKEGYPGGSAGLFGTYDDYSRFGCMLANGGEFDGKRILSEAAVFRMGRPSLPKSLPGITDTFNWGLGVRVVEKRDGERQPLTPGSFGWSGAFNTHFWVDRTSGLTAVFMSNLNDAGGAGSPTAAEFERDVMREDSARTE